MGSNIVKTQFIKELTAKLKNDGFEKHMGNIIKKETEYEIIIQIQSSQYNDQFSYSFYLNIGIDIYDKETVLKSIKWYKDECFYLTMLRSDQILENRKSKYIIGNSFEIVLDNENNPKVEPISCMLEEVVEEVYLDIVEIYKKMFQGIGIIQLIKKVYYTKFKEILFDYLIEKVKTTGNRTDLYDVIMEIVEIYDNEIAKLENSNMLESETKEKIIYDLKKQKTSYAKKVTV